MKKIISTTLSFVLLSALAFGQAKKTNNYGCSK